MTARKPKTVAEPSHEAEHEQDVVSEAKPAHRLDAVAIADALTSLDGDYHEGLDAFVGASSNGNRLTITVTDVSTDLVQTFHATVEPGVTEF